MSVVRFWYALGALVWLYTLGINLLHMDRSLILLSFRLPQYF